MDEEELRGKLLTGNYQNDLIDNLIEEQVDLPLDLITMGFNYSTLKTDYNRNRGNRRVYRGRSDSYPDSRWLHLLYFSTSENRVEFLEEILLSSPSHRGDIIMILSKLKPQLSLELLTAIHHDDDLFVTMKVRESALTKEVLGYKRGREANQSFLKLFHNLKDQLRGDDQRGNSLDDIKEILLTPDQVENNYGKISSKRSQIIDAGALSEQQADALLNALASFVVKPSFEQTKVKSRTLLEYFEDQNGYDGPEYKYRLETEQFIKLLSMVSQSTLKDYAEDILEYAGFWIDEKLDTVLYERAPEIYGRTWLKIIKDNQEAITAKTGRRPDRRSYMTKLYRGLLSIKEIAKENPTVKKELQQICISLISVEDESTRSVVQSILNDINS